MRRRGKKSDFICKKCGSTEYEIKDKPNGTGIAHGLYCAKCGFWHKWLGKEELKQYATKESKDEIIVKLQSENAALRERLEEAVNKRVVANMLAKYFDCPCNFSPIDEEMYEFCDSCAMNDVDCWEKVIEKNIAEACLKELKEKSND